MSTHLLEAGGAAKREELVDGDGWHKEDGGDGDEPADRRGPRRVLVFGALRVVLERRRAHHSPDDDELANGEQSTHEEHYPVVTHQIG